MYRRIPTPTPRLFTLLVATTLLIGLAAFTAAPAVAANPQVVMKTSKGTLVVELFPDKSPKTVENFLAYVEAGHYDGTIFHRVIPGFMVQGGGFTRDMQQKSTRAPVENESDNELSNERGTIAMARTGNPHSATSQFYINVVDNPSLDYSSRGWGYTVFGKVVEGMDVADAISKVSTTRKGRMGDVPQEPVVIEKVAVRPEANAQK